jgi:hypothetical protein
MMQRGATIHIYPAPFSREARVKPPFPADPHDDAKAWELCADRKGLGCVLFRNVAGGGNLLPVKELHSMCPLCPDSDLRSGDAMCQPVML